MARLRSLLAPKRLALICFFVGGVQSWGCTQALALPKPAPKCHWQPIPELTDEFSADLDASRWAAGVMNWPGRAPGYFYSPNVLTKDGTLILRSSDAPPADVMPVTKEPARYRVSGISSKAELTAGGYYEVRMKASRTPFTSSFWMQGKYSEIDVVENVGRALVGRDTAHLMLTNLHYFPQGWDNDHGVHKERFIGRQVTEFNTYGVWWKSSKSADFFYNNQLVYSVVLPGNFDEPMRMFLDTEPVAKFGYPKAGNLDSEEGGGADVVVDYVHSYRLIGSAC